MKHLLKSSGIATLAAAAMAATTATPSVAATNLLRNGSFETVGTIQLDQGFLPEEFLQSGNIAPGADTYSNDGSFGLPPGGAGNFIGAVAQDGIRFAAGADFGDFGSVEAIGQQLATPLAAGGHYTFSGWIADSFRADTVRGGFKVMLSPSALFNDPGAVVVGSTGVTSGLGGWQSQSVSFVAPSNAATLGFLVLAPFSVDSHEAYIGIDNIRIEAVPEPATFALAGLGLLAVFGATRRRGRA